MLKHIDSSVWISRKGWDICGCRGYKRGKISPCGRFASTYQTHAPKNYSDHQAASSNVLIEFGIDVIFPELKWLWYTPARENEIQRATELSDTVAIVCYCFGLLAGCVNNRRAWCTRVLTFLCAKLQQEPPSAKSHTASAHIHGAQPQSQIKKKARNKGERLCSSEHIFLSDRRHIAD